MAFPTGWGRKCAVVIANAQVSGTSHTDFPVLVTMAMLPSEMFDADGDYPALSGGGDVRFSSDSAGVTQIACEVVSFVTDNNPANGSAEIWVKVPTLSGSVDTTIYVWYDKAAESQPAVTDTYGRNSVWKAVAGTAVDYSVVAHDGLNDSTGNTTITTVGTVTSVTGKIGDGVQVPSTNSDFVEYPQPFDTVSDFTVQYWQYFTSNTSNRAGFWDRTANPKQWLHRFDDGDFFLQNSANTAAANNEHTNDAPANEWCYFAAGFKDGATVFVAQETEIGFIYDDDTAAGFSTALPPTTEGWTLGGSRSSGNGNDRFDEHRAIAIALSEDWLATEFSNQDSPATFATAGTPESVGATIPTLSLPGVTDITATSARPQVTLTY